MTYSGSQNLKQIIISQKILQEIDIFLISKISHNLVFSFIRLAMVNFNYMLEGLFTPPSHSRLVLSFYPKLSKKIILAKIEKYAHLWF